MEIVYKIYKIIFLKHEQEKERYINYIYIEYISISLRQLYITFKELNFWAMCAL